MSDRWCAKLSLAVTLYRGKRLLAGESLQPTMKGPLFIGIFKGARIKGLKAKIEEYEDRLLAREDALKGG